jgi:hypothetical protein
VDLQFKLGAFEYFATFIFSSCQGIISLSFLTLEEIKVSKFATYSFFNHGNSFGGE